MGKARGVSGGGPESRQVRHVEAYKKEPVASAISVGAVSRIGTRVGEGTPYKPLYKGPGYNNPKGPTPCRPGVGGGREIFRAGSQSPSPRARPMTDGKDFE
jgi:hypothetical protein